MARPLEHLPMLATCPQVSRAMVLSRKTNVGIQARNTAVANGAERLIVLIGQTVQVKANAATGNAFENIVTSVTDGVFTGNTALGNGSDDLEDGNTDCDNNRWTKNTFGTANQPCIE